MKIKNLYAEITRPRHKLIARFGQAKLVRWPGGKYELIGGLPEDLAAAREWISIFLHEAVPACKTGRKPILVPTLPGRCIAQRGPMAESLK